LASEPCDEHNASESLSISLSLETDRKNCIGPRAAQVVPHVHFHIIPRPDTISSIESRSWTMFGRGRREDLDEEEAEKMAKEIRGALSKEIETMVRQKSSI
jgi:diadenosine tetraphosphate (Ap4A) HIT family hydrolase